MSYKKLVPVFPLGKTVAVADRPEDEAADKAAIRALWVKYETAVLESDGHKWIELWDREALRLQPQGPSKDFKHLLHEEIDWIEKSTVAFTLTPKEIVIMGDLAYSMGTYAVEFEEPHREMHHVDGKFISILRRQDDGGWRIFRSITNAEEF